MIRSFFLSLLETGSIIFLILWFFITVGIVVFTVQRPDIVQQFITMLIPKPSPSPFHLKGIGVIGDSQSDEYRADDNRGDNYPSVTYNWVEILSQHRHLNFGTWGTRAEPRRTGYAYNWARSGATALSMIESGQHIGLAQQVKEGKVNLVIISIGANDYAPYLTEDGYEYIYEGALSAADGINKRNKLVANIKTAIDTIQTAGKPKILLILIPDWGQNLGIQVVFPLPQQRQQVTTTITDTNNDLILLAKHYNITTINPNTFYRETIQKQQKGKLHVDSVTMERLLLTNDPKNMFLSDGIHLGTILNGLFTNKIISVLNTQYGTKIDILSEKEIIEIAGLE